MNIPERIEKLRELMLENGMDAYIIVTDDFHGSEYVGDYFKAREYMSGFTGSAGTLIVLRDWTGLWTDGRYFLQAEEQLKDSTIALMKMGEPDVLEIADFLEDRLPDNSKIGFDGRTVSNAFAAKIADKTAKKNITFVSDKDLAGLIWNERPALSKESVWELDEKYAGMGRDEKLKKVKEKLREQGADMLVLTALDEIAWLLNLRGNDVKCTPVFLSYMTISQKETTLFVYESILGSDIKARLSQDGIKVKDYESIYDELSEIESGMKVWIDGSYANYRIVHSIPDTVEILEEQSPVILMKAVKTPAEMENMRLAHIKDGVAVTKFIYWLKTNVDKEIITELSAAKKLEEFRMAMENYIGPGFEPILGYGPHGAIVHYEATEATDVQMHAGSFCLADTGGHYMEGTTDVTRTIPLGKLTDEEKKAYTLVLRGHLNLGAAKFLHGVCGQNLDCLARGPLWENNMDYNHGTGHGVGYILNVHEGPHRIHWRIKGANTVPLEEGMVVSNEPGLYIEGRFGVRHENLVMVRKGEKNAYGQFMYLEELTMVPFDKDAIDFSLMSDREIKYLNNYHKKVYDAISPWFEGDELRWLRECTSPVAGN